MKYKTLLETLLAAKDLSSEQMTFAMHEIMSGHLSEAQIAAFLVALRAKGETAEELATAAAVMRDYATTVDVDTEGLVDTCGTGGDGAGTFNISTATAIVAAAAGVRIAKHGNRLVSSNSGSADFLEAAGVNIGLNATQVAQCIQQIGIGFLFAPCFHQAMKHVAPARKSIAIRTVFNLLGPLANPAAATTQLIGVFDGRWLEPIAQAVRSLGIHRAMIVHGEDGMDEISINAPTQLAELRHGDIRFDTILPADFGIAAATPEALAAGTAEQSVDIVKRVFDGEQGAAHDIIVLNAGAVIYLADKVPDLARGVEVAREAIASAAAANTLQKLIATTQSLAQGND